MIVVFQIYLKQYLTRNEYKKLKEKNIFKLQEKLYELQMPEGGTRRLPRRVGVG